MSFIKLIDLIETILEHVLEKLQFFFIRRITENKKKLA